MSTKDNRILTQGGGRYPFKVSDEYFDNLTARIMERIDAEEAQPHHENERDHENHETRVGELLAPAHVPDLRENKV